jgi:hypothetical protein
MARAWAAHAAWTFALASAQPDGATAAEARAAAVDGFFRCLELQADSAAGGADDKAAVTAAAAVGAHSRRPFLSRSPKDQAEL